MVGENAVMAILLGIFFALHVLAGALLQDRASTGAAPVQEAAKITLHD